MNEKQSRQINIYKAFSIFCVICAHCNTVSGGTTRANYMVHYLLNTLGTIGVGCFFAVSGYLFACCAGKEQRFSQFLIKKIKRLIVPWIFCGTLVWLYIVLRKGGASVGAWAAFLWGKGSYLYFIPVLFILYVVFWFIDGRMLFVILGGLLSVGSNILTELDILPMEYAYINVLNWLFYFAIGICFAKWQWKISRFQGVACILLTVLGIVFIIWREVEINYWTEGFMLFEIVAGVSLWVVSGWTAGENSRIAWGISTIGRWTLAVYLLHMPIAGIVANIFGRWELWYLTLARPFVVLFITLGGLGIWHFIACRVLKCEMMERLVGIK